MGDGVVLCKIPYGRAGWWLSGRLGIIRRIYGGRVEIKMRGEVGYTWVYPYEIKEVV